MKVIHIMVMFPVAILLVAGGCSTANTERDRLCTVAFTSNDVDMRVDAIEKLNQMDEPGFGYYQILQDNRINIPARVEIIKRHYDALTQDQLKELAGINNIYEVRKTALLHITDKKYLLRVSSNKSVDTLADFAKRLADQLGK